MTTTIRCYRKSPVFAEGGLIDAAEHVRGAGRKNDEILLHLSPGEFEAIRSTWGEPDVNPHTGLPEYAWLSDQFDNVKSYLSDKVLPFLSNGAASVGNTILPENLQNSSLSKTLGATGIGALASLLMGKGAGSGAKVGALLYGGLPIVHNMAAKTKAGQALGLDPTDSVLDDIGMGDWLGGRSNAEGSSTNDTSTMKGALKSYWPLILASLVEEKRKRDQRESQVQALQDRSNGALQQFNAPILQTPVKVPTRTSATPDYYTYGEVPETPFFRPTLQDVSDTQFAQGGSPHVRGPGTGRSDSIPARLSDGEYVMDAETVSLLGDGSNEAGARRLDEMRKKLRMDKGKKLSKGEFSGDAKLPEDYLAGGEAK